MKYLIPFIALLFLPGAGPLTYPDGSPVDCYCTDSTGSRVELGQHSCLTIGSREVMAYCDMSQNVPIWRQTGEGCLTG